MFDGVLPGVAELAGLDAAGLVEAAGGWARAENAACARKLAVMAEIFTRRTGLRPDERELWWIDPEAAVSAELAAAQNISRGMALAQTHRGVAVRDRLPKVAALFAAGLISDMLVRAIVWRTELIIDEAAMAAVDGELAEQVTRWGALSVTKTEQAIDALIDKHDPGALRRARAGYRSRDVAFGAPGDEAGFTSMWARLYAHDAALVQQRVEEMDRSVCAGDPRTLAERRADALGALGAGTELACTCGQPDCPAAGRAGPAKNAVVYVIAEQATIDAARTSDGPDHPTDLDHPTDPGDPGGGPAGPPEPQNPPVPPEPGAPPCPPEPAFVLGGGILPAPLLGPILDRARMREIVHPGDAPPEPRYTPSPRLARFVRCRDLTCRFPGCNRPATHCDLDHTVPHPYGPTHASNLKCLCRFHRDARTVSLLMKMRRRRGAIRRARP
ncbi:MAG TPA: DUF222 domain-containing protein, partial [Mycobacterium sp.]|nr:DUF222 domain-containing protein [Mycobacterium sp.]